MTDHHFDPYAPEWEPVWKFFYAHLHQDYDAMYGDAWEAVRDFASEISRARIGPAARGLRRLLTMFDNEEDLASAADRLGMAYYPPADGYTYRSWLEEVADFLESKR